MNVADYLGRIYPSPPCWALVADVYTSELGEPVNEFKTITETVRGLALNLRLQATAEAFRLALHKNPDGFSQMPEPIDYALVMLGKTHKLGLHHCGVYYQGSVLHANDNGNFYQSLVTLQAEYALMAFWAKS